jgi:hypothetical protein
MAKIDTPPTPSRNSGGSLPQRLSHRERDDSYAKVIAQLGPRWRVIICKDGIQWILQQRSVPFPNTGTWAGKSYSTTRDALIAACSDRGLLSEPHLRRALDDLPSDARTFIAERSRS